MKKIILLGAFCTIGLSAVFAQEKSEAKISPKKIEKAEKVEIKTKKVDEVKKAEIKQVKATTLKKTARKKAVIRENKEDQ